MKTIENLYVSNTDLVQAKSVFVENGVVLVRKDDAPSLNFVDMKAYLLNLLAEYQEKAHTMGGLGLRKENGFRELVQKDVGRFDSVRL
jgi:hypothetical protein